MKIILRHGSKAKADFKFSCLCGCVFLTGEGDYESRESRNNPHKTIYTATCPECEREGLIGMPIRPKEDLDAD